MVEEAAKLIGVDADSLDSLFALEPLDANAPEPFPSPISYRDALTKYMDLDATPSPAAIAAAAEALEEADPDASDRLFRLAGAHQALSCGVH